MDDAGYAWTDRTGEKGAKVMEMMVEKEKKGEGKGHDRILNGLDSMGFG